MKIYNALDLKSGKKTERDRSLNLTQPLQFLPGTEKDEEWYRWNLDWLEWQGLKRISVKGKSFLKKYKLAAGVIDRNDYIPEESDPDYKEIYDTLIDESNETPFDLKFYSIIPNIVNTLVNEFTKRNTSVKFRAIDDSSHSELLAEKSRLIKDHLVNKYRNELSEFAQSQGQDIENEEVAGQIEEQVMSLPQIQEYIDKDYQLDVEQWANHQKNIDEHRFKIEEQEEKVFRDSLVTNESWFHFRMLDDDYVQETWNPVLSWCIKSPEETYLSNSLSAGQVQLMTISDAIDIYGPRMNEDQILSLESIQTDNLAGYNIAGLPNDGSLYDSTRSHEWNMKDSVGMKQYLSEPALNPEQGLEVLNQLFDYDQTDKGLNLVRVSTSYWKSQRRYGHLTRIDELGNVVSQIVTEDYEPELAIYNKSLTNERSKSNLIQGDHIDWIWVNEVCGGVKISSNYSPYLTSSFENEDNESVYIGVDGPTPGPLKYQFKGDDDLYGAKLPIEGAVYGSRNTESISMVDLLTPSQISYNVVTNQINDILIDELGSILLFDQNALPRHSNGEDWGDNNLAKAYVAMKDFQMLPLDTSISNTENPLQFQHYQQLNLEQTNRLLGRVNLANYFKQQAYETIGISPQRVGAAIEQQTAEGIRAAVNNSYSQTEHYFVRHSDYLMPRVHQMRTDLAQHYNSTNPSLRLSYSTSEGQKINFEMNGTKLLLRNLNVYATTKVKHNKIVEQLRQLALSNNTSGASIFDLGSIIESDNLGEIKSILKNAENKSRKEQQAKMENDQKMLQQKIESEEKEKQLSRDHEALEAEKNRRKDVLVAEIRASQLGAMQDLDGNKQNDFVDNMEDIRKRDEFKETINVKKEVARDNRQVNNSKLELEKEKLRIEKYKADAQMNVAKTNKNKYDV